MAARQSMWSSWGTYMSICHVQWPAGTVAISGRSSQLARCKGTRIILLLGKLACDPTLDNQRERVARQGRAGSASSGFMLRASRARARPELWPACWCRREKRADGGRRLVASDPLPLQV